jgi:hypothetical protein
MALVLKDRVLETASSPGTGTVVLLGASTGYQDFANGVGNANTTYYTIATVGGAGWEVGIGTYYSANNSIVRNTVISSSNAGNLVNFSSGTQSVFVTYPAEEAVYLNNGNVSALGNITLGTWNANTIGVPYGGTGIVTLNAGYIPYGNGTSSFASNANLQFASNVLEVGPGYQLGGTSNPLIASVGSSNGYVQSYVFNNSNGTSASADFVAYADNSSDAHGWVDFGYSSSTYNDAAYSVTGPNEAYIFGSAPTGSGTSGNLVYATDSTGTTNSHQWYVGGFGQAKNAWKMQLTSAGLQLASALPTGSGGTGLTTFTSGGAVYATSSSELTSGTLPVTAGGTGFSTLTAGRIPYGAGTSALASSSNLSFSNNTVTAPFFNATADISANVAYGAFNNGTLGYSDTGIFGSFVTSQNSYGQFILQNISSGNAASADYIVSNDLGTKGAYYGDFGINGSTFAGTGSLALPNATYLYAVNGELVLGTTTNNGVRIVTNSSATDAVTINSLNAVAFNGSFGNNTFLLQSTGNATAPIWQSPANISAGSVVSTLTFTSAGNGSATGVSFNGSANQVISSNTILPAQSGNANKYLKTDGANALSWSTVDAAIAVGNSAIVINNVNVTSNATIAAGQNGFSVGPVYTANGVSVTISSGQRWVVI